MDTNSLKSRLTIGPPAPKTDFLNQSIYSTNLHGSKRTRVPIAQGATVTKKNPTQDRRKRRGDTTLARPVACAAQRIMFLRGARPVRHGNGKGNPVMRQPSRPWGGTLHFVYWCMHLSVSPSILPFLVQTPVNPQTHTPEPFTTRSMTHTNMCTTKHALVCDASSYLAACDEVPPVGAPVQAQDAAEPRLEAGHQLLLVVVHHTHHLGGSSGSEGQRGVRSGADVGRR